MGEIRKISMRSFPATPKDLALRRFARNKLLGFNRPFIQNAGEEIYKLIGASGSSIQTMRAALTREWKSARDEGNKDRSYQFANDPLFSPVDFHKNLIEYADIHAAILRSRGLNCLQGARIMQLAPNWGPYLYYLREACGSIVDGIDMNTVAVRYAKEQGKLPLRLGDAARLPFGNNYFDIIISRGFMVGTYLDTFSEDPGSFMETVIGEVHRTLKPGGMLLSHKEDTEHLNSPYSLFSSFSQICFPTDEPVCVLQK
jgi:hypothetical protein